ncbi:MAG: hypothetical protein K0S55_673 [Clostridia bacterium]|nr:hypothetical protein [Clostridia bacterium]
MKKYLLFLFIFLNITYLTFPFVAAEFANSESVFENSDAEPNNPDTELFLRLHIRANSDSNEDQALKLKVRNAVLNYTSSLLENIDNKADAMEKVSDNLEKINSVAAEVIKEYGFTYTVETALKKEYFEKREYEGFFLPADIYDSLILEIGKGEGHNWWCVIFPAVCVSGSIKSENKENANEKENQEEDSIAVINTELIPEKYRMDLAESPVPQKVKYEFWIVNFIKDIISFFNK